MYNSTWSSITKISRIAAPITTMNLINIIASLIPTIMLARLGKEVLAASALANSTYLTLSTLATTCLYAISILISKYRASGHNSSIKSLLFNGLWVSLTLGVPSSILLWHAGYILILFKQDPHLVKLTVAYFHYAALGMIPLMLSMMFSQFYIGIGLPFLSLIISIARLPIAIIFSYCFILGKFGCHEIGLAGITFATLITNLLCLLGVLIHIYYSKKIKPFLIGSTTKIFDWQMYSLILRIGVPIGMQFFGELGAMSIATYFMGYYGVTALAASQVVSQYTLILVMIVLGISQAFSILVSEAYGKQSITLIDTYTKATLLLLTSVFACFALIYTTMPMLLMAPFINIHDAENLHLISLTKIFLVLGLITLFLDGIKNIYSSGLRGFQNSKLPMLVGVGSLWIISLPICYATEFYFSIGPVGMRVSFMSGFIVATIILWKYFLKEKNLLSRKFNGV